MRTKIIYSSGSYHKRIYYVHKLLILPNNIPLISFCTKNQLNIVIDTHNPAPGYTTLYSEARSSSFILKKILHKELGSGEWYQISELIKICTAYLEYLTDTIQLAIPEIDISFEKRIVTLNNYQVFL